MTTRNEWAARPGRESLRKRLGKLALRISARDGHACVYCRRTAEASGAPLQLDHLLPRSLGGEDLATNLVVACKRCNATRHTMPLARWAGYAEAKIGIVFDARTVRAQARRQLPAA